MVELKEFTYQETLLRQLHFILGIWSPLKVFTDLTLTVFFNIYDGSNFGTILNIWDGKSCSKVKVGEFRYTSSYSSRAKGFISADFQGNVF